MLLASSSCLEVLRVLEVWFCGFSIPPVPWEEVYPRDSVFPQVAAKCVGRLTSLTTVLWSLRSGLGTQFREFGGPLGERRGGLAER